MSVRLERARLSAPIFFVVAGFVYGQAFNLFEFEVGSEPVQLVAEVTLVWVLFGEAAGVNLKSSGPISGCTFGCSAWACR